jgi:hypothetical protein
MWRVLLALLFHRLLLLIVALISVNNAMVHRPGVGKSVHVEPVGILIRTVFEKVRETPEAQELERLDQVPLLKVFVATKQPFLWVGSFIHRITHLPISLTVIFISNFFLFFFLWELFALVNRMVTPDTAVSAVILVLLWPTSYELSLGSALSLTSLLAVFAVRHSLDSEWLLAGVGLALLALVDPIAAGLAPLMIYMFWYFQRGFPLQELAKKLFLFALPVGVAMAWRHPVYFHLKGWMEGSALFTLFKGGAWKTFDWTLSRTLAGQTITIVFFITGALAAAVTNATLLHRMIPLYMLISLLTFTTYSAIASRACIAGICLQGIASISARPALRIIQCLLLILSMLEVAAVFSSTVIAG